MELLKRRMDRIEGRPPCDGSAGGPEHWAPTASNCPPRERLPPTTSGALISSCRQFLPVTAHQGRMRACRKIDRWARRSTRQCLGVAHLSPRLHACLVPVFPTPDAGNCLKSRPCSPHNPWKSCALPDGISGAGLVRRGSGSTRPGWKGQEFCFAVQLGRARCSIHRSTDDVLSLGHGIHSPSGDVGKAIRMQRGTPVLPGCFFRPWRGRNWRCEVRSQRKESKTEQSAIRFEGRWQNN